MEQENNNLDLREFGYTDQNLQPVADTRDLTPALEMPELNIAPISYPSETPVQKIERAKKEIPSIVDRIRKSTNVTFADESMFAKGLGADLVEASKPKGMVLHREDTNLSEIYDTLSDGTLVPRYESFVSGTNNEERLARGQGTWTKWGHGITKLVAKTGLYGIGGIVNPVYGAIDAIRTGNFDAVYNNDFMDWVNDQDTRMNYSLPNYYTGEEKNRSFISKMATSANFWANDVLGGVAFTTGALVSEAFWSALTGGASLVGSAARLGMRTTGRSAVKGMVGRLGRNQFSNIKTAFGSYLRGASSASKVAGAINNGRFIMTSAGWEASVEASHYMKEAELDFVNTYRAAYGKNPSAEELEKFRGEAASAGNLVFGANIGVVGLSNILQFGKYFGAGAGWMDGIDRSVNRALGLGVRFNKAGNVERIAASKLRKGLGVSYNLFKRPFTEGVWEEGTQGVIGESAKAWIKSRYDPEATEKSMSVINAINKGFAETYGTQEGRMEIGIGALIGAITGIAGGKATGWGGITEYTNQSEALDARVEAYNETNIPEAAVNLATRIGYTNQQIAAMDEAGKAEEKRDARATRQAYDKALFTKFMSETDFGLLEEGKKNFVHVIENMNNQDLISEYNISEDEAIEMKKQIIEDYSSRMDEFKKANEFAESITAGTNRIKEVPQFREYIAMNAFLGLRAGEHIKEIADQLSDIMGDDSYRNALNYYASLSVEGQRLEKEKFTLNKQVTELEEKIRQINAQIGEDGKKEEYAKEADRLLSVRSRINEINEELSHYRGALSGVKLVDNSFNLQIESAYETLDKLDGYIHALSKSKDPASKYRARLLGSISEDLAASFADYNSVNEMLERMMDPRFMEKEAKGLAKLLEGGGKKYEEKEDLEGTIIENKELEAKIEKNLADGKITDAEAFTLRTFLRMNQKYVTPETQYDNISDEDWDTYQSLGFPGLPEATRREVTDRVFEEDELTPREKQIYEQNKSLIDNYNQKRGDNIKKRLLKIKEELEKKKNSNFDTAYEANQNVIENAINQADEEEQSEIRAVITLRNGLMNDLDDGKYDVDQDVILDLDVRITEFGQKFGVDDLIDFIEQNRIIKRGLKAALPTGEVVDMTDLVDHSAPPESSRGEASFDNAQNIEMLTAKKDNTGNNYIVSGMKLSNFVDMLTKKMGATEVKAAEGEKGTILNIAGVDIHLYPAVHNAVKISQTDVEKIQAISIERGSGLIFTLQPSIAGANSVEVLWLNEDRSLSIIPVTVTYGKKGRDVINDRDVLKVKGWDRIIARIDFEDDYNRTLWRRYRLAKEKYEKAKSDYEASDKSNDGLRIEMEQAEKAFQSARTSIKNNLVIKLIDNERNDGAFVSVVKSIPANQDVQKQLSDVREKAAALFIANAETRTNGHMEVGTYKVARVLPGRPSLNMRLSEDGTSVEVKNSPITALDAEKIVTVGYMLNGKTYLKDNVKFKGHPFTTLVARNSKYPGDKYYNKKMPIVIVEHPNGNYYAYPVTVNQASNSERKALMGDLNFLLDPNNEDYIDRQNIMFLNTSALKAGVNPNNFIRLTGSFEEIRKDIEKLIENLNEVPNAINVEEWLTSSRSAREIAMSDATINISLSSDPFHAPKLVMDFSSGENSKGESNREEVDFSKNDDLFAPDDWNLPFMPSDEEAKKLLDIDC